MKRYQPVWERLRNGHSVWPFVVLAIVLAALLAGSLGAAGASSLFQSPISPTGPAPTDTPVVTAEPTVLRTVTVIVVEPTPFPTSGELPPPLPTTEGQPTVPPPPTSPAGAPTAVPVPPPAVPTVPPQPTTGSGPTPVVWIIVGLVLVGLVVVIALSPKKPSEE